MKRTRHSPAPRPPKRFGPDPAQDEAFLTALRDKLAGRLDAAAHQLRDVIARHPGFAPAFVQLAEVVRQQGRFDQALDLCQRGLDLDAHLLEGRIIRGVIHGQRGDYQAAVDDLRHVLDRNPSIGALHVILGDMLHKQNRLDEACEVLHCAIALDPRNAPALANLGTVLQKLGCVAEACVAYRQAVAIDPRDARSHSNLAGLLSDLGDSTAAIAAAREAVRLAPGFLGALVNLAAALSLRGDLDEAIETCRQALRLGPDHGEILGSICHLRQHACDWAGLADEQEALRTQSYARGNLVPPFRVITALADPAEHLRCARLWAAACQPAAKPALAPYAPRRAEHRQRPLRIGYLSGDFHNHATAMLIAEMFELHDKTRFTLFGYSLRQDSGSAMRRRLVGAFDSFADLQDLSNRAAAERIHADGIDILIDLKGYTVDARTAILADRPAPIQVNYLGFPGTMGAPFIDYIIADAVVAPMDHAAFYDEKIVQLPHCYQPNDRRRIVAADPPRRAACGLPIRGFVFCCINNSYKITPQVFAIWMRLLDGVPGAVLWLFEANRHVAGNLRREALQHGIDPGRLIFAPRVAPEQHAARLGLADLFLDTLPVNAHTTASEALWVGLPVLTCMGEAFAGRVAASLLRAIDLPELVTTGLADYEATALALARDPAALARLRDRLSANRTTMPLFDAPRYTANFEAALVRMSELRDAGEAPQAFAVPDRFIPAGAVPCPQ